MPGLIALLQRVSHAQVDVQGVTIASIGAGLLVFIGVERGDTEMQADHLLQRLLEYRVFADSAGKMNLSLQDIKGDLLLVPQFTLAADTRKGKRPSFTPAAPPEQAEGIFNHLLNEARRHVKVESGHFGADMQVTLTNDGPVTFLLSTQKVAETLSSFE